MHIYFLSSGRTSSHLKTKRVLEKVISEVRGLNSSSQASDIRGRSKFLANTNAKFLYKCVFMPASGAAYHFYRSCCEDESLKRHGKADEKSV